MDSQVAQTRSRRNELWIAAAVIAAMVLVVYGDVLLRFDNTVISHEQGDTSLYFAPFREFGFRELASGNLPLWNPHVFSGAPFVGGFQSAMFYPPNLMYMVLPLAFALNLDVCVHTFLLGLFTFLWIRPRVSRLEPALFAAAIVMFGGPYALRVLAGQLTMLSSLAYAPLLMVAIDRVFDAVATRNRVLGPVLLGVAATSLQVLAGYPGTVFMTAFTAALYCGWRFLGASRRAHLVVPLLAIAVCPVGITLVQLWVGAETAAESIRAGGGSFEFASSFSFPLENLLTLVAPATFGDDVHAMYWGRWKFWDVSVFCGVTGIAFVAAGLIWGRSRGALGAATICVIIGLVSFGRYTPVYGWLFEVVPGFQSFRAPSKFMFFASLFLALIAALGLDQVLAEVRRARSLAITFALPLGLGLLAAAVIFGLVFGGDALAGRWGEVLDAHKTSPEAYVWVVVDSEFAANTRALARTGLVLAGSTGLLLCALLWISRSTGLKPRLGRGLVLAAAGLGLLELVSFARVYRGTFQLEFAERPLVNEVYGACTNGERVLDIVRFDGRVRNYAVEVGGRAVWGYDPVILRRYGDFCTFAAGGLGRREELKEHVFTWGSDPFGVALNLGYNVHSPHGLENGWKFLWLLRPRFVVRAPVSPEHRAMLTYLTNKNVPLAGAPPRSIDAPEEESVYEVDVEVPEFYFATRYVTRPGTVETLQEMAINDVDFGTTVVLESEPDPAPTPVRLPAKFGVLDRSTDHFTIYAELPANAILIATHAYSAGWRAMAMPGSAQDRYTVMPAYHALMAIPLSAGVHEFRLEYAPAGYRYGRWVSLVCAMMYLGAVGYWLARRRTGSRLELDVKDLRE